MEVRMIESREDLRRYIQADLEAAGKQGRSRANRLVRAVFYPDYTQRFLRLLRHVEYHQNCARTPLGKLHGAFLRIRLNRMRALLGFSIAPNSVGPGLFLPHIGTVVIHDDCRIGENFTINVATVIGVAIEGGPPQIGNGVTVEPGAKIFGDIRIADDVVIGANAVVNSSFLQPDIAIAGVPARKIGDGAGTRRREALEARRANRH
jgi:serine O-acetyltransferase